MANAFWLVLRGVHMYKQNGAHYAVSFTGALYVIVFALIGLTTVHPLAPILLSSFALSTNAITFIASIPVLVGNDALLGTAFGVWKAFVCAQSRGKGTQLMQGGRPTATALF